VASGEGQAIQAVKEEAADDRDAAAAAGRRGRAALRRVAAAGAALLFAVLASACEYRGDIDISPTIKFTWFSYLNGDDIRENCRPGAPFHYRLVYNADYAQQVRIYTLAPSDAAGSGGAAMVTRVSRGSGLQLNSFNYKDPLAFGGFQRFSTALDAKALGEIQHALEWSGAYLPAPKGLRLYSDQYYWVAALCHDGKFTFNAWLYPSERYDLLSFPRALYAHDNSGIAVPPPRDVGAAARMKGSHKGDPENQIFQIRVGDNGLVGLGGL
jgi:hypothetical protein